MLLVDRCFVIKSGTFNASVDRFIAYITQSLEMATSRRSLRENVQQFCLQTTIHGFSYVEDQSNVIVVKAAWFLLIVLFMSLASYLINLSFYDWAENPTITTTDSAVFPIEKMPFPAVTVCQEDDGIR